MNRRKRKANGSRVQLFRLIARVRIIGSRSKSRKFSLSFDGREKIYLQEASVIRDYWCVQNGTELRRYGRKKKSDDVVRLLSAVDGKT